MSEQRVERFSTRQCSGGGNVEVRQTRTVTSSMRTGGEQSEKWTTVTTQETYTTDGKTKGRIQTQQQHDLFLEEQFDRMTIPKTEEKTKRSFFSGMPSLSKSKKEEKSAKPQSTEEFQKQCLEVHNKYRAVHGVPAMKLSKDLCKYANEWVTKLAKEDRFQHRPDHKYGENIFMKWSSDPNYDITGNDPVEDWYSEIKFHIFDQEPRSLKSGHFSQVVWEGSRELGVAKAKSASGKILVVANYNPPGNMLGDFCKNVHPPKK